jgi:cardiolipin synthase
LSLVYLPNLITLFRLFMVPVLVWMIVAQEFYAAFLTFVVVGISDALDGWLARRFGWQTELGAYLDPIADKALLMSIYGALGALSYLPAWLVILVISRDLLIVGAFMLCWLLGRTVGVHALLISKINTAMQITLAVLVLAEQGLHLGWTVLVQVMIWATGATTALSAAIYLVDWLRRMADYDMDQRRRQAPGSGATPPDRPHLQ